MRKTRIDYEGGIRGADRRLQYAAKNGMITPFEPDEADALLDRLHQAKGRLVLTRNVFRNRLEEVLPEGVYVTPKPDSYDDVVAMVSSIKRASRGDKNRDYSALQAQALIDYEMDIEGEAEFLQELLKWD